MEKLVAYSFVSETKILGTVNEGCSHNLTADGRKIIDEIKNEKREECEEIKNWLTRAKNSVI